MNDNVRQLWQGRAALSLGSQGGALSWKWDTLPIGRGGGGEEEPEGCLRVIQCVVPRLSQAETKMRPKSERRRRRDGPTLSRHA
jgi:hypothetical protein